METRGHCDTAEPHGTKETLVTLGKQGERCDTWHVSESNVHGDTADLLGTKENIVTRQGPMEPRRALWHCKGSWNQGTLVTQGRPMDPSVCCDIVGLQGTKGPF